MMSTSPSPGPIDVGRFELGSTEAGGAELPLVAAAVVADGAVEVAGDGLVPLEHALRTMPRLVATANTD
jgi:hypothetical protein